MPASQAGVQKQTSQKNLADFASGVRLYGCKRKNEDTQVEREPVMKLKRIALLFLVSAVTGWVGYYVGVMWESSATHMPRGATVSLDYLASAKSFSEVEHARAVLDALAVRYVENAQGLIAQELMSRTANFGIEPSRSERPMLTAIKMLDEAIPEFRGTGVELRLLQPLLYALKQERLYDRWLDVYLDALYRHPAHEMVSALAEEAVVISRAAGRERELNSGLRYVGGIPQNSLARTRIEHSSVRAHAKTRITGENYECRL
jgi:hypothetical protein